MGPNTTDFIFSCLVHIPLRLHAWYGLWAGVDEYTHGFHSPTVFSSNAFLNFFDAVFLLFGVPTVI